MKNEPKDYDPYADLIEANRDQILRMHQEAVRRLKYALDKGRTEMAVAILDALNTYHPMHGESWCGWPEGSEPA